MKIWLILQTILFESASLYLLGENELGLLGWISYASSHAAAAATFTALCWLALPKQFKQPLLGSISFIFVIAFSMPIIGMVGLSTIFIVALYFPKKQDLALWNRAEEIELPIHPEEIEAYGNIQFGAAALKDILLFNPSEERRLIAVNACRFLPQKDAMPLLKLALTDTVDDVRLLAYSAIEKIEFNINRKLDMLKQELQIKPTDSLYFQVAELYWELCYLGIAEGPLRIHYLSQAKTFFLKADSISPSARSELKLGRVLLELQQFDDATHYLEKAHQKGLLASQVSPYLAESAFAQANYNLTAKLVNNLKAEPGTVLNEIKEFWYRGKN